MDSETIHSMFQEFMKSYKEKQVIGESSNNPKSFAHFAGNHLTSLWIVDSGATGHMSNDPKLFIHKRKLSKVIEIGLHDGSCTVVHEIGDVNLCDGIMLHDVLLVPSFKHNLLSVGKLAAHSKIGVHFKMNECSFMSSKGVQIAIGKKIGGLYYLHVHLSGQDKHVLFPSPSYNSTSSILHLPVHSQINIAHKLDLNIFHARLGHSSLSRMKHVDSSICSHMDDFFCEICIFAKHHKSPFPKSKSRAQFPFALIHIDLWGPYRVKTLHGASYFLTILDDFSRTTWIFLLNNKSQVYRTIASFLTLIETQYNKKVLSVRSDNGTEIIQDQCLSLFANKGIFHQKSIAGVPQQNGRVERKHKHLLEVARSLKFHSHLPSRFWGECLLTATYLINKIPTPILNWKSPFEILTGQIPDYDYLRVFGCLCYAHNMDRKRDKFSPRAVKCVFIGYPYGQKGYKVYNIATKKCFVTRDVIFKEDLFPFKSDSTIDVPVHNSNISLVDFSSHPLQPNLINSSSSDSNNPSSDNNSNNDTSFSSSSLPVISSPIASNSPSVPNSVIHASNHGSHSETTSSIPSHNLSDPPPNTNLVPIIRHSTRQSKPPAKLQNYICPTLPSSSSHSFSVSSSPPSPIVEPFSYKQACLVPEWRDAMNKELSALENNDTWCLTSLPSNKKAIASKWIFKVKYNPDGTVERYKARLVAVGYQQVPGKDYTDTFSPVAKIATVRIVISLATAKGWPLCQLDINNAFLHGFLDEEVYMHPPLGYDKAQDGEVCKLKRSLYGLKQASRQWNKELSKFLLDHGFIQSCQDYSLFTRHLDGEFVVLLVYDDDIVLTGTSQTQIDSMKVDLDKAFTIKDLGTLKYFLGVEVIRSDSGVLLSQRKYIHDIIQSFQLSDCKNVNAPLPKGLGLSTDEGDILDNPETYRQLVGRLSYLNITRPDLSYATQHLSQFLSCPRRPHYQAAIHVVKYLKSTIDLGLFYSANNDLQLKAYSDADWSSCVFSCKS